MQFKLKKNLQINTSHFELRNNTFFQLESNKSLHEFIKHDEAEYETKISLYENLTQKEKSSRLISIGTLKYC